ncbi:hypothetical protein CC1G_15435 [Coprinopsis cinerea okayama7|uniref:Uncharacterized protein n=1 Tax=Coprinopsis cinerea (strain Okayama-7 / 130 / ATCC MYA-4618 / FGSC 9003) TaxID=240176 RepID=D6RQN8_COPC7|nr:hypothetical protein CC1G_15435 [Coprinopsis cinerea okayama7\|eukprot:XP_002910158.1 hypothetical protein CC1G_15435 [Coprinopsis cinerea okayama7\
MSTMQNENPSFGFGDRPTHRLPNRKRGTLPNPDSAPTLTSTSLYAETCGPPTKNVDVCLKHTTAIIRDIITSIEACYNDFSSSFLPGIIRDVSGLRLSRRGAYKKAQTVKILSDLANRVSSHAFLVIGPPVGAETVANFPAFQSQHVGVGPSDPLLPFCRNTSNNVQIRLRPSSEPKTFRFEV